MKISYYIQYMPSKIRTHSLEKEDILTHLGFKT
jgi:hypothetical protein